MNISDILQKFRNMSSTQREQGKLFEKFIRQFLLKSKLYGGTLTNLWLWSDFPYRNGKGDMGIDLVARTNEDEYWAIQCKFYEENHLIPKDDVDSFLSESGKTFKVGDEKYYPYSFRLLFVTADLNANARETLEKQYIQTSVLNVLDLSDFGVDWETFWDEFDENFIQSDKEELSGDVQIPPMELRPHQQEALNDVLEGFKTNDRGKLIMACGTGKTFASLKITERMFENGGLILYLVPSLSLLAQTLRAWTQDSDRTLCPILVCSDSEIHDQDDRRKKALKDDEVTGSSVDLAQPATTNPNALAKRFLKICQNDGANKTTVVFSTYQSLEVVEKAQKLTNSEIPPLPEFDLAICDEAHRTTGVTLSNADETSFVFIHDNSHIKAKKRLYMTATPRIYAESAKKTADESGAVLCSMDDESRYGKTFHRLDFGKAVAEKLLTDYKVIILTVPEEYAREISERTSLKIGDENGEVPIDDFSKILGCWNALCKKSRYLLPDGGFSDDFTFDPGPMKRAVAFCSTIKNSRDIITPAFVAIADAAADSKEIDGDLLVDMQHIDGTFGAARRKKLLNWLNAEPYDPEHQARNFCHILSNVRCLSEGVDVPSLDAVLFLSPRNSQVEIIQSVGRVMRKAEGKKYGYVILPIVLPENKNPEEALDDNKRYKVVWQVLQALRAHDERFDVMINQLKFNDVTKPGDIPLVVGGVPKPKSDDAGGVETVDVQNNLTAFEENFASYQKAIVARVVKKCGSRGYLDEWAQKVAKIAAGQIGQIEEKLRRPNAEQKKAFDEFLAKLQREINPSIDREQTLEALAQHMAMTPVFDALFKDYSFVKNNVVSQAMQKVLDVFQPQETNEEKEEMRNFRREVKRQIEGIQSSHGKLKVMLALYDQFFKVAFPKVADRLGIVYTPVELVDFIIRSVEVVLKKNFNRRLSNSTVHALDPFTGTGTFITRLLQSGLIDKNDFRRKFNEELHANEIVLLAYYIAAVNIEEAFHGELAKTSGKEIDYVPFPGIVLTDTFQMNERPLASELLVSEDNPVVENNERISRQRRRTIEVIFGNPPYSVGQGSANDANQNVKYPKLDKRIEETYVADSKATNKNSLYDSYIKAFRWASDRIAKKGVVAFVTNAGWIDGNAMDGFRKRLVQEFSEIYVFNLRGNARTSGEQRQKEGGNAFGSGSRAPIAVTILVKNETAKTTKKPARVFYYDVGDYLKREQKLAIVRDFGSLENVPWLEIQPNEHGDWINQRGDEFFSFFPLGKKENKEEKQRADCEITVFEPFYSRGYETGRDAWVYNYSRSDVEKNTKTMVDFYNRQVSSFIEAEKKDSSVSYEDFINSDTTKISWTRGLKNDLKNQTKHVVTFEIRKSLYRPFSMQYVLYDFNFVAYCGQIPKLFPTPKTKNLVICISGVGANKDFSALISDTIPCLDLIEKSQCFPLYYYAPAADSQTVEDRGEIIDGYERRDGITDAILKEAKRKYSKTNITKEDIFYYVYGLLYSPKYRENFAADLKKSLARIPFVKDYDDFLQFSDAGRMLAELHLNYDSSPDALDKILARLCRDKKKVAYVAPDVRVLVSDSKRDLNESELYRVEKMKFAKKGKDVDRTRIVYNPWITIADIPGDAYEYVVNGKSALEWIMERYAVTTDKASGIQNDPNRWNVENPKYIVDLIRNVVAVSTNTVRIVRNLPKWNL